MCVCVCVCAGIQEKLSVHLYTYIMSIHSLWSMLLLLCSVCMRTSSSVFVSTKCTVLLYCILVYICVLSPISNITKIYVHMYYMARIYTSSLYAAYVCRLFTITLHSNYAFQCVSFNCDAYERCFSKLN